MIKKLMAGATVGLLMFGGVAQATDNCAAVDSDLNVNIPCVDVRGQLYQVTLNAHSDSGWYWTLGAFHEIEETTSLSPIPQTGQTTCYNDDGGVIACADTGQDGDKLNGVPLPNPRFTINNDGTVADTLTGLIWLANANCATVSSKAWTVALAAVASLKSGDCGLTDGSMSGDWRMPNSKELYSLVNNQYSSPPLSNAAGTGMWSEGDPFSGVQLSGYWSSSTFVGEPSGAWAVAFDGGYVGYINKAYSAYVWPVRGGQ